jgi:hypothetical protein
MFDLNTLAIKDSYELHLRDPRNDELLYADEDKTQPIKIVLHSTSSKAYRAAINAMQNRALKRGKKQASAEVMREEGVELLVACTQKGVNLMLNGNALDCPEAFRSVYSDDKFSWIKDQVDSALGDVSNFIEA